MSNITLCDICGREIDSLDEIVDYSVSPSQHYHKFCLIRAMTGIVIKRKAFAFRKHVVIDESKVWKY